MNITITNKTKRILDKLLDDKRFRTLFDKWLYYISQTIQSKTAHKTGSFEATGRLFQSLSPTLKVRPLFYKFGFSASYAEYVEFGTRPHMPPPGSLIEWVKIRFNVTDKEAKGLDYVIRKKIARRGTKGKFFMRDSIDETNVERELKTLIRKWQDVD
jgi:hypothetical protein